jgi:hypothetical protein
MLSFSRIGMPCSGPRGPLALRSASSARAIAALRVQLEHARQPRAAAVEPRDAAL